MYEARGEGGGLKEASMAIKGGDVFRNLKFESGVHRVSLGFVFVLFEQLVWRKMGTCSGSEQAGMSYI